jgi:hypothetical protein
MATTTCTISCNGKKLRPIDENAVARTHEMLSWMKNHPMIKVVEHIDVKKEPKISNGLRWQKKLWWFMRTWVILKVDILNFVV